MPLLSDEEWRALLETVRDAVEEIASGSGFGRVTIECVAGAPKDIHIDRSLRFRRDICPEEETIPQAATRRRSNAVMG